MIALRIAARPGCRAITGDAAALLPSPALSYDETAACDKQCPPPGAAKRRIGHRDTGLVGPPFA